jgi:hypothetical protein
VSKQLQVIGKRQRNAVLIDSPGELSPIAAFADIPEEDLWLAAEKQTCRAYKLDVQQFMRTLSINSYDELRQVDHQAVIAWDRIMQVPSRRIDNGLRSTVI